MTLHFEEIVGGSTSNSPLRHEGQHLPLPPQQRHIHDQLQYRFEKKMTLYKRPMKNETKTKKIKI
jgi:hypothetical protein